jgi:hypothetical protein
MSGDVALYRKLLVTHSTSDDIEYIVSVFVTDTLRTILLTRIIPEITSFVHPYGETVITGGEVFNVYVDKPNKVVASDIDTKIIPLFNSENYFRNLQIFKILLWNKLNIIINKYNLKIKKILITKIKESHVCKMLGINIPKDELVKRRYTLMMKTRKSVLRDTPSPDNVLIDVELFALDIVLKFFDVEKKRVSQSNVGGMLDMAVMRPGEFGSELAYSFTKDKLNNNIASKIFFIDDLYTMYTLGLRPKKKRKDIDRLTKFAKHVTKLAHVKMPFEELYRKTRKKLTTPKMKVRKIKFNYTNNLMKVKSIDPLVNSSYISKPSSKKMRVMAYGIKGRIDSTIKTYKKTHSTYRFNVNTSKWTPDTSDDYIRNMYNYRLNKNKLKNNSTADIITPKTPYGYSEKRDRDIHPNILRKSRQIQYAKR